jgi:hypothetical protein
MSQQEEAAEQPEQIEMQPMEQEGQADAEDLDKALDDNVSPEEFQDHLDNKYNFSEGAGEGAGEGVGEGVGEAVGEVAGEAAGEGAGAAAGAAAEGVAGAVESVGSALDATGVLAPFGFLLNIAGLFAAGVGAVEAGETIAKELSGPDDKDIPRIPVPKQPKTMAQKGLLVTPHFNSLDTYGSVNTAW